MGTRNRHTFNSERARLAALKGGRGWTVEQARSMSAKAAAKRIQRAMTEEGVDEWYRKWGLNRQSTKTAQVTPMMQRVSTSRTGTDDGERMTSRRGSCG